MRWSRGVRQRSQGIPQTLLMSLFQGLLWMVLREEVRSGRLRGGLGNLVPHTEQPSIHSQRYPSIQVRQNTFSRVVPF